MNKLMKRMWKKEEGFTLIELIIVVAILAIIAAVAIPNVMDAVDNSRRTADVTNARMIAGAAAAVRAKSDTHAAASLAGANFLDGSGDAYMQAIVDELGGNAPELRYKGDGATDNFMITVVASTGEITITAQGSGDELYPIPHAHYNNQ